MVQLRLAVNAKELGLTAGSVQPGHFALERPPGAVAATADIAVDAEKGLVDMSLGAVKATAETGADGGDAAAGGTAEGVRGAVVRHRKFRCLSLIR